MSYIATVQRRAGTLLLGVDLPPIAELMDYAGRTWVAKEEFHVTLIGNDALRWLTRELRAKESVPSHADEGDETLPFLDERLRSRIQEAISRAAEGIVFRITLRDDVWELREATARTLIRIVEVEGAEEFFRRLESDIGVWIERPPYHVTIYCAGTDKGIGVRSAKQLRQLGQPVDASELLKKIEPR